MIEIIQTGQAGKTKSLIEMHKVRKLIFKDRMNWDIDITKEGLEIDDYDLPETVYILVKDEQNRVTGVWRMLPSTSPSMIRDIWPDFLKTFPMKVGDNVWEVSRFGIHSYSDNPRENVRQVSNITAQLITGLLTVCNMTGITDIYTMYNPQVGRSVRRIGFIAEETSQEIPVDGKPSIVGRFKMNKAALERVTEITGITYNPQPEELPPILYQRISNHQEKRREAVYA